MDKGGSKITTSTRLYKSGAEKRKKRQILIDKEKKLKGSLDKFVLKLDNVVPENDAGSSNTEISLEEKIESNKITRVCTLQNIHDPGLWQNEDFETYREYFCANNPIQNKDLLHTSIRKISGKERTLTERHFFRLKKNDESVSRDWLVYSPSKCALFCFVCKLYSSNEQSLCDPGYTDWKNVSQRLSEHENSTIHRDAVCSFSARRNDSRIDCNLVQEQESEFKYWRNVLRRVVEAIKFLCQRGLPIFGSDETIGSLSNGNFLGSLELISMFDPFMAEHLEKFGNVGRGKVNYLSSTIVNELIQIMGDTVLKKILQDIYAAKYFGIILDSTPDISHVDQLSVVIRYVDDLGKPVEHFLKVLPLSGHSSSNLFEVVSDELKTLSIDFNNCRGQSYDNASNMAGRYSGLQARLKVINPLAEYVPCSAHSLNLVGSVAAECCNQVVSFFGFVQSLYCFFSISTHRWEILMSHLKENKGLLTLKSLSGTRWSARADATKALRKGYIQIKAALREIVQNENNNEKPATRHEAYTLLKKLDKLETAILTVVWDTILQRINKVSKTLQGTDCSCLCILVPLFKSLEEFMNSLRDNFKESESEAQHLVENGVTYVQKRKRKVPKSKMLDDSSCGSTEFDERSSFIYEVHNVLCDSLTTQLAKRKEAYKELEIKFGFLYKELNEENKDEIYREAEKFQQLYAADIDEDFVDEYIQFRNFLPAIRDPAEQLKKLKELKVEHTFPNVDTCLRILLSLPISNSSGERSFSTLKRIKNYLRSNLKQEKLNHLILLCVESETTCKLDFEDVISIFAEKKSRKKL